MSFDSIGQTDWLLIGGGAAAVAWYFRDKIMGLVRKVPTVQDAEASDFAAYLQLRSRAASRGGAASAAVAALLVPLFGDELKP